MSYITNADVGKYLNMNLTASGQALIDTLIPAVEAYVDREIGHGWGVSAPQTEVFDGSTDLFFPMYPISSISSISVDDDPLDTDDFYSYGSYVRLASIAGFGRRNVTIVYTPVNTPIPADLKQAIIQWVAQMFKEAEDAGKVAESVNFGSVSVDYLVQDGIPKFVENVINKYKPTLV